MEWNLNTNNIFENFNNLGYETDILDEVINSWDTWSNNNTNIWDIIFEVCENFTPIYNYILWKDAPKISIWIEEAIEEYGIDVSDFNLISILQNGFYYYFRMACINSMEQILWNFTVKYIKENNLENILTNKDYETIEKFILDNNNEINDFMEIVNLIEKNN